MSQPTHRNTLSPAVTTKPSVSESYYSSYGESEVTPTPKPSKTPRSYSYASYPYSYASYNSESCRPNIYRTPTLAQTPRESVMDESGYESDEVYDQFDLGEFTKEEIKAYESMLGPGERLRDAAPPEKSLTEMLEDSCERILVLMVYIADRWSRSKWPRFLWSTYQRPHFCQRTSGRII